jgi:hypothetical protein
MIETNNQLAELSHLAQVLNKETDAYSEALSQLENKLKKMNLGIEAWVNLAESSVSGNPMRSTFWRTMLGFAKTSDGWGFAVKQVRVESGFYENDESCPWENHYDESEPKLLLKASREQRIIAAQRMEYLLKELTGQARATISFLQQARYMADKM